MSGVWEEKRNKGGERYSIRTEKRMLDANGTGTLEPKC